MIVGPARLPPDLVVLEEVRAVRRGVQDAVDAAGPESFGIGRVDEVVFVELVGQVELRRPARTIAASVDFLTRCAMELGRVETLLLTRVRGGAWEGVDAEPVEPLKCVLVAEAADAGRGGQVGGDVPVRLPERCVVAVDTHLLGEPPRVLPQEGRVLPDPQARIETVDDVALLDAVLLTLLEKARDKADRIVLRRSQAQLVAVHLVAVGAVDELRRIRGPVRSVEVIPERVIRVVGAHVIGALEESAGVGQLEVADLAFDRQRRIPPTVLAAFVLEEMLDRQVVGNGAAVGQILPVLLGKDAVPAGILPDEHGCDRPALVQVDLERRPRAVSRRGVVVLFRDRGIVQREARARIRQCALDVIDVAGVALVPANQPQRRGRTQRDVDESFRDSAGRAVLDRVALQVITCLEAARIGLVGDDADRAGLRAGAVQRPLWPRQHLDPRDIVNVDIERTLNRRDRLLIQIRADAGQRTGMVGIVVAGDAAHEHA